MPRRILLTLAAAVAVTFSLNAQTVSEFKPTCDSLRKHAFERTGVQGNITLRRITRNGTTLSFQFAQGAGEYPWRPNDEKWFKQTLKSFFPDKYKNYTVGTITVNGNPMADYLMPEVNDNGKPGSAKFRTASDPRPIHPFIEQKDAQYFEKGMSGRNIALWQSHGRYYEEKTQRWEWQRAPLMQTVEDMYTQSYVLPFLIPMLENAGAYVMTPRERDPQRNEVIMDNDKSFGATRAAGVRVEGKYSEKGKWKEAGTGFADLKETYTGLDNPFMMGTARVASCREDDAEATWTPKIPERGEYSVYISYKTMPHSTTCAHYTVKHLGGKSEFYVNQRMGGGTWIYLGTFEFDEGSDSYVMLDTKVPEGRQNPSNAVITADAVRMGGGMGKIARGQKDSTITTYTTSGMPSFTEGALYWMQWAGTDTTVLKLHEDDYTSDYGDRGAWVGWMSGGSRTNPKAEGLKIPIDMSFAFHTDAGITPNDSIVGSLSIYTLKADGSDKLPNGERRLQQRMYADYVQTEIVNDIRRYYEPKWSRRGLWDRSYSESRTTTVPAMLLELLSHQNFADMKYGHDPSFRFTVSRAIYKGMLKYLSSRYGCQYAVQPLPVNSFATSFTRLSTGGDSKVRLSWKPTVDSLETTADPAGYILYTRIDDGAFNNGEILNSTTVRNGVVSVEKTISPGHVYGYKIVAFNDGGKSFPSEVLTVGVPAGSTKRPVLVVNNFTRVASPTWFDTPEYAGFNNEHDGGVPYIREINFIGEQYEFRRDIQWTDDDSPGFGASYSDQAGNLIAGNTFDFTGIHGKALMDAGYPFHSASSAAFTSAEFSSENDAAVDIICGKQVTTKIGSGRVPCKYSIFPEPMQKAISQFTASGGNVLISGAYIGTDAWDRVYPIDVDKETAEKTKAFVESTLGYKWLTNYATHSARIWPMKNDMMDLSGKVDRLSYSKVRNPKIYCVEQADGIVPASDSSRTILRYQDTNISAATCFLGDGYKAVSVGFPLETIQEKGTLGSLVKEIMAYFERK